MRRDLGSFRFKQFQVAHSHSTIPVGTDAVLLGAWTGLDRATKVLDVGSGTGVIGLCMAQRGERVNAIHSIDIDLPSVLEADRNFKNSKWSSLFTCFFSSFSGHKIRGYNLIVSNPPFFRDSQLNTKFYLERARHQTEFDLVEFARFCKNKLKKNGKVALVYPAKDLDFLTSIFETESFSVERVCVVYSKKSKAPSRVLIEFALTKGFKKEEELVIYNEDSSYTSAYKNLTKDFYLNF